MPIFKYLLLGGKIKIHLQCLTGPNSERQIYASDIELSLHTLRRHTVEVEVFSHSFLILALD